MPSPNSTTASVTPFARRRSCSLESILREDRSVVDLLDANYTFVNERLARFYGIPNVHGTAFRRVTLTDANRGGLLGQGSILTVTSYPNRTSVVQRGKWILENVLGTPPPPPPANVPDLKSHTARRQAADHAPADGTASRQLRLRILPLAHGPARICAGELRRRRQMAHKRCRRRDRRLRQASRWHEILRTRRT